MDLPLETRTSQSLRLRHRLKSRFLGPNPCAPASREALGSPNLISLVWQWLRARAGLVRRESFCVDRNSLLTGRGLLGEVTAVAGQEAGACSVIHSLTRSFIHSGHASCTAVLYSQGG